MIQPILSLVLFSLLSVISEMPLQHQAYRYNIVVKGKKIGELTASRFNTETGEQYLTKSQTEMHMLRNVRVDVEQKAVLVDGILEQAQADTWVNGKLHRSTEIKRTKLGYELVKADKTEYLKQDIRYSSILLILKEPVGADRCFSEQEHEFHDIEKIGEYRYRKTAPDGRENLYHYEDGRLKWAQVDAGWYTFEIRRH